MDIAGSVRRVMERVENACRRAGRSADEVTVVAATKYVQVEQIKVLLQCRVLNIGENRVQDAQEKFASLEGFTFIPHMIGHLQRNKVRRCLELFKMIHSVDSWRLAKEIDKESRKLGQVTPCLLQVNISGEESKFGFRPDEVKAILPQIAQLANLKVKGLMTMAPLCDAPEQTRPVFRGLRELADELRSLCVPGVEMCHLSMGMSNDYEIAIEEGATMVRIGSAFFAQ